MRRGKECDGHQTGLNREVIPVQNTYTYSKIYLPIVIIALLLIIKKHTYKRSHLLDACLAFELLTSSMAIMDSECNDLATASDSKGAMLSVRIFGGKSRLFVTELLMSMYFSPSIS